METRDDMQIVSYRSTHPGEVLEEWLDDIGIKQKDFANKIGIPASRLNEIIKGKRPVTEELAKKFEAAFDMDYTFWLRLQAQYDWNEKMLALRADREKVAEGKEESLKAAFNLKELYRGLKIDEVLSSQRLEQLFGVLGITYEDMISRMSVVGCFKHSEKLRMDERNMRTWVIIAQYVAGQKKPDKAYTPNGASMAAAEIAAKANSENITESDIERILSANGIAYVVEPKLPGCPIDAYSVKINGVPSIITTHRHNNMEKLIFDVLHELGHIDMHIREDYSGYINIEGYESSKQEKEANEFARNALIAPDVWNDMLRTTVNTVNPQAICNKIAKRAKERGINPRIAVARYRHDSGEYRSKTYAPTRIV